MGIDDKRRIKSGLGTGTKKALAPLAGPRLLTAKEAEDLSRSEARFRSLVQNSSDIITILEAQGTIRYATNSVERILGYRLEEFIGSNYFDFIHPNDRARTLRAVVTAARTGDTTFGPDVRFRHSAGNWVYLESVSTNLLNDPTVQGIVVNSRDVSDRKSSEQLQSALYSIAEKASSAEDLQELFVSIHSNLTELMYAKNCFIALHDAEKGMIHFPYWIDEKDPAPTPWEHRSRKYGKGLTEYLLQKAEPVLVKAEEITEFIRQGEVQLIGGFALDWLGVPLKKDGRPFGALVLQTYESTNRYGEREKEILTFVSQQVANAIVHKQSQQAIQSSENRYRGIFESVTEGMFQTALDGHCVSANPSLARILGYSSPEELMANLVSERLYVHPAQRMVFAERLQREDTVSDIQSEVYRKDGSIIWISENVRALRDAAGALAGYVGTIQDITASKRAEQLQSALYRIAEMTSSVSDLQEFYRAMHQIVGELMYAKNFYVALYDSAAQTLQFVYAVDEEETFPPEPQPLGKGLTEYVLQTGQPLLATPDIFKELCRQGIVESVGTDSLDWLGVPLKSGDQTFGAVVVQTYQPSLRYTAKEKEILTFVSQHMAVAMGRKRSEEELRHSESRYRTLFQSAVYGMYSSTISGRFKDVNPALIAMLGYDSAEEVLALDIAGDVYFDAEGPSRLLKECEAGGKVENLEAQWKRKDGAAITVRLSGRLIREEDGSPRLEMIAEEITERRQLEEQLRQSQKMDAVGKLAGGVAHDFNNLLTIIKGYAELVLEGYGDSDPRRSDIEEVKKAAERAASLTRQLLAFSRQQSLDPRLLALNSIVADMEKMLHRLLGEDIRLKTHLDPRLHQVKADQGQVEQVLMNLVVNARDAMPRGGTLTITTSNLAIQESELREHVGLQPGDYVVLSVADTGIGMDAATQSRIFEPFFTTKEHGKGTGLGLSTVYGIVKQSAGSIQVRSTPGSGSVFTVFLPGFAGQVEADAAPVRRESKGKGETVLLVEDEEGVRLLVKKILDKNDYKVLEARDGEEAILRCKLHPKPIHLLLTDIILGKMSGPQVAEHIVALRPGISVLYMSGYTHDAISRHASLAPETMLLQKPFNTETLIQKVREALQAAKVSGGD